MRTFQNQTYADVVAPDRPRGRPHGVGRSAGHQVPLPHPDDDELRPPQRDRLPHRMRVVGRRHRAAVPQADDGGAGRRSSTARTCAGSRRGSRRRTSSRTCRCGRGIRCPSGRSSAPATPRQTRTRRREPRNDRPGDHRAQRGQAIRRHVRRVVADRHEPGGGDRARHGAGHTAVVGRPVRPRRVPRTPGHQGRRDGRDQGRRHAAERDLLRHHGGAHVRARRRHGDDVHDGRCRAVVDRRPARRRRPSRVEGFGRSG